MKGRSIIQAFASPIGVLLINLPLEYFNIYEENYTFFIKNFKLAQKKFDYRCITEYFQGTLCENFRYLVEKGQK